MGKLIFLIQLGEKFNSLKLGLDFFKSRYILHYTYLWTVIKFKSTCSIFFYTKYKIQYILYLLCFIFHLVERFIIFIYSIDSIDIDTQAGAYI